MPLLLIPLVLLAILGLIVLTLPFSIIGRYRAGTARQRLNVSAAEPPHEERVVVHGRRILLDLEQQLVVAGRRELEALAYRRLLEPRLAPPRPFEVQDGAVSFAQCHEPILSPPGRHGAAPQRGGPVGREPGVGIEPTTSCLQDRCSTN